MTENKIIRVGKVSQLIIQFFRYAVIVVLLIIVGMGTTGMGAVIGIIFFKSIQRMIPFKISIYSDFLELIQHKIGIEMFKNQFRKKLVYNLTPLFIALFIMYVISVRWLEYKILYLIILSIVICILLFQIYYFKIVGDFVNLHKENYQLVNEKFFSRFKKVLHHIFEIVLYLIMIISIPVCAILIINSLVSTIVKLII